MFQPFPRLFGDKIPISEKRPKDSSKDSIRDVCCFGKLFLRCFCRCFLGCCWDRWWFSRRIPFWWSPGLTPRRCRCLTDVGVVGCRSHRRALLGWMTCRQDQYRFEKLSNIIKQLASQEWSSYSLRYVFIESFLEFRTASWNKATCIMIYSIRKVHWSAKIIPSAPSWSLKSMVTDVTSDIAPLEVQAQLPKSQDQFPELRGHSTHRV